MTDLNKIPLSIRREMLEALRRRDNAKKAQLSSYTPRQYQLPFHQSQKIVRIVSGGNQIGKSTMGAGELKYWIFGEHPYRKNIKVPGTYRVVTSQGFTTGIAQVIQPKLREIIPNEYIKHEEPGESGIIRWDIINGSIVHFMTTEQAVKMHQAAVCDAVWIDEPPPFDYYIANLRGILSRQGAIWITNTPILSNKNLLWLMNDLYEPWENGDEDITSFVDFFFISMDDATVEKGGHLTQEYLNIYKSQIPKDLHSLYIHGRMTAFSGRIFKEFNRNIHVIDNYSWDRELSVIRAIDPGDNKPHRVIWVGISRTNDFIVINELEIDGNLEQLAQGILQLESINNYNIVDSVVDPAINKEDKSTGLRQRELLDRNYGLKMRLADKKDMVIPGIMYIRGLLQNALYNNSLIDKHQKKPALYFFRSCDGTISNMLRYRWGDDNMPVKKDDDYADALRYAIMARPKFDQGNINKITIFQNMVETYGVLGNNKKVEESRKWEVRQLFREMRRH